MARLVNELDLTSARRTSGAWTSGSIATGGKSTVDAPAQLRRADRELCFNRIRHGSADADESSALPEGRRDRIPRDAGTPGVRCAVMQGGQGDVKHWAFNDPLPRRGRHKDAPPPPAEYRKLATRVVDLHPLTITQNARTTGGGNMTLVPTHAISVGPVETWKAEKVSIWHAGKHDNPFGQRLTALMISKRISTPSVPMSLLADHPNVQFNFYRGGIGRATWRCTDDPAESIRLERLCLLGELATAN